jgi:hypothetical protein
MQLMLDSAPVDDIGRAIMLALMFDGQLDFRRLK